MISPNLDPYAQVQQRLSAITNYAKNPFGAAHMGRSLQQTNQLSDDERQGWLGTIKENTLGSLAKVANVLDVPGSSVRDVASMVTGGGWKNPFDQMLPWNWTKNEGRTTGRDLGRQWGWMDKKDTWGNLAGGIGLEMAMDPLIPLGLGLRSLSKGGRVAEAAGLLGGKHQALLSANAAAEKAAAVAGTPFKKMGMREWMRKGTLNDLLQHAGPAGEMGDMQRTLARTALEELSARTGFKDAAELLAKHGDERLMGIGRYGLPDWKMFGAKMSKQFKQAPGFAIGKPGGAASQAYARFFDKTLGGLEGGLGAISPMTHMRSLLQKSAGNFISNPEQRLAKAAWEQGKFLNALARKEGGSFQDMVVNATQEADAFVQKGTMTPEMRDAVHKHWRDLQEQITKNPRQEQFVTHAHAAIKQVRDFMSTGGVKAEELDDLFPIAYFPRQMTELLKNGADQAMAANPRLPLMGTVTEAFNVHNLGRQWLYKDMPKGTSSLDEIIKDKRLHEIVDAIPDEKASIRAGAEYIMKTYGKSSKKAYLTMGKYGEQVRGRKFSDVSKMKDEVLVGEFKTRQVDIVKQSQAIWADPNLSESQKALAEEAMLARNKVTGGGKFKNTGLTMQDDLWELKDTRFHDLSRLVRGLSPEARKLGLFNNSPISDFENYLGRAIDSGVSGRLNIGILSDPNNLSQGGKATHTLAQVLEDLHMDVQKSLQLIAERRGFQTPDLQALGQQFVNPKTYDNLEQFNAIYKGPKAAEWGGRVLDSFMNVFKANVTSPFPAFHARNFLSGQLRNVLAGQFSFQSMHDAWNMLHGKPIVGLAKKPVFQQRYAELMKTYPDLVATGKLPLVLNDEWANRIAGYMAREHQLTGRYGGSGVLDVYNQSDPNTGESININRTTAGLSEGMGAGVPGNTKFGWMHAVRSYLGMKQPAGMKEVLNKTTGLMEKVPNFERHTTMGGPYLPIGPVQTPMTAARKLISKVSRVSGRNSERMQRWAAEPWIKMPTPAKVRGVYENFGLGGSTDMVGPFARKNGKETLERNLMWGPSEGGQEIGHAVESMNRLAPWLHQIYEGVDPVQAANKVSASQISYASKDYTAFEQQKMKRVMPFYSFTSRSLPWTLNKFFEEPGNMLAQVMRATKRTAEHKQGTMQSAGPVPDYLGDTLAIPMKSPEPGVKRFLTGFDLMDQDLWQLGAPLLSGDVSGLAYELAGRSAPHIAKLPIELLTKRSLFQRGLEGGRPLRDMDPLMGRTALNALEQLGRITGEKPSKEQYQRFMEPGLAENLVANSYLTRYLSTARTALDPRKGLGAKAVNLLTGAKVQDVSVRAQETGLREQVNKLSQDLGAKTFEITSFPAKQLEYWRVHDPAKYAKARQLTALSVERVKIAKALAKAAKLGIPEGQAYEEASQGIQNRSRR